MKKALLLVALALCANPLSAAWSNVKEVRIDPTKVGSADLTDFPMLVSGTYSYLANVANGGAVTSSSGHDIIFAADSAGVTPLSFERVAWNASTGAVQFRVKVPSVSHTTNTTIYLLYGNSAITTDQQNATATWPAQFKSVYHLESTSATDSTGTNNGTPTGANLSVVSGQVGSAVSQSSVSPGSYISLGSMSNVFNGTNTSLTISGWFNNADVVTELQDEPFGQPSWPVGSVVRINAGKQNATPNVLQLMFGSGSGGGTLANQVAVSTTTFTVPTTTWYHVSMTLDLTTLTNSKIYVNGVAQTPSFYEEAGRPTAFTALATNPALFLSNFNGAYRGTLDEIRFSTAAPSDSWVLAEYNNESSPSTFYTVASPIVISGPSGCKQATTCTYSASGGTGSYAYSLVGGSVGSINSSTGVYTAPAHVYHKQVLNGCPATPNNHIFNTRIDNLPVDSHSSVWLANSESPTQKLSILGGLRLRQTVLSTDPGTPMSYVYAGPTEDLIFRDAEHLISEAGTKVPSGNNFVYFNWPSAPQFEDNHIFTTYRDNCKLQEVYNLYPVGSYLPALSANSASGLLLDMTGFSNPGYGTNLGGMPISPLVYHTEEFVAAAAGDVDAIKHASQLILALSHISPSFVKWPSVGGGSAACGALDDDPTTAKCLPVGARLRLVSTFTPAAWFTGNCAASVPCQNIVYAVVRQLQRYGTFVTDVGTDWATDFDGGPAASSAILAAINEIGWQIRGAKENWEVVDEESLHTTQTQGTPVNNLWQEAKLDNGYVTPDDAAVVHVVDSTSGTGRYGVALQGVVVGVEQPIEVFMAGAAAYQFHPWVTGSSNTGFTCSLSGGAGGAANGTITSGCLYTAPPNASLSGARNDVKVTVTSSADSTVSNSFTIAILPLSPVDGKLHISLGKVAPYVTGAKYTDNDGIEWWNDATSIYPLALFPDFGSGNDVHVAPNYSSAPHLYDLETLVSVPSGNNDMHFYIHTPNGSITSTFYAVNYEPSAGEQAVSYDCGSTNIIPRTDFYTLTGSVGPAAIAIPCTQTISNGLNHLSLRFQGIGPDTDPLGVLASGVAYHTGATGYGLGAAAITIEAAAGPPPPPPDPVSSLFRGVWRGVLR